MSHEILAFSFTVVFHAALPSIRSCLGCWCGVAVHAYKILHVVSSFGLHVVVVQHPFCDKLILLQVSVPRLVPCSTLMPRVVVVLGQPSRPVTKRVMADQRLRITVCEPDDEHRRGQVSAPLLAVRRDALVTRAYSGTGSRAVGRTCHGHRRFWTPIEVV